MQNSSSRFAFGDYLVFVDESGDHGLVRVDPEYPIFVLAFCLFQKAVYVEKVGPALQKLKLKYWGHDEQVLHEHEIRKPNKDYHFLFNREVRNDFIRDVGDLVEGLDFLLVATVIRKNEFSKQYTLPANPYELAMQFGLERVFQELSSRGHSDKRTHVIVEKRGDKEDKELELAFRRIVDGSNGLSKKMPMDLVMIPKSSNSTGLQIADLVARPVGIKVLRPAQPNRAYDIVVKKFRKSPAGEIKGWGLKVFP